MAIMSEKFRECVTRLRALTQQLLDCARAEAWEETANIETIRRPLLYYVFGKEGLGRHYPELLSEILETDREIMTLAQQRRDALADILLQTGQGRAAMKAYSSNRS